MRNIDIINLSTEALKTMQKVLAIDLVEAENRANKLKEGLLAVLLELEARGEKPVFTKGE